MSETVTNNSTFSLPLAVKMVMIDLDGTLIDTAPDIAASANKMLEQLGLPIHDPALVATWIGNGVGRLVKRALIGQLEGEPDAALFEKGYPIFLDAYAKCVSRDSHPYEGVVEGLDALKQAGFSLACVTNKAEAFTMPLLEDLGLDKYFELVLSGDVLPKKKPDPLPLLHACEFFGISPDHGVLVGDSINDVQAARAAGMPVILVPYGYNRGQDVNELDPDAIIDSLTDLSQHLSLYTE
ncbi:MAG: phosphoglycolate phosphatase [Acidiferrobacterales bacterium]